MARTNNEMIETGRKAAVALLYLLGTMLGTFNLLAFKSERGGVFYQDANQWWVAIAAAMFVVAWLLRNWKKL